ncbi:hypothetical protein MK489_06570 [Myxococcota bacterium]|nr:hypothetical protein [Myxococcota bacterium]
MGFHALFGMEPKGYFSLVLLTHIVNTGLLARLLWWLSGSGWVAFFGASIWAVSPAHSSVLGWYSAYGHVVATTAFLWVAGGVAVHRANESRYRLQGTAAWCAILVIGAMSYATGIAIACVFPFVLALFDPRVIRDRGAAAVMVSLPFFVIGMYFAVHHFWGQPGHQSPFEISLLKPNAIADNASDVWRLLTIGFGVLASALTTSAGASGSWIAVGFLALLVASYWLGAHREARTSLAWFLLAMSAYLSVSLGRGEFAVASFMPVSNVSLDRYQYLATSCLVAAGGSLAGWWLQHPNFLLSRGCRAVLVLGSIMLIVHLGLHPIANISHESERNLARRALQLIRTQVVRAPNGPIAYLVDRSTGIDKPIKGSAFSTLMFSGTLSRAFVTLFDSDHFNGKTVRFVTSPGAVKREDEKGLTLLSRMLVSNEEYASILREKENE